MVERYYNKLVRDKILDICRGNDSIPFTRILSEDEFLMKLKEKLVEESKELMNVNSKEKEINEIADILEIIYFLIKVRKYKMSVIENHRKEKGKKRGSFNKGILLEKVVE